LIIPIATPGQNRPTGFVVAGLSPRRIIDADYRSFFDLVGGHVGTAIANARAYELSANALWPWLRSTAPRQHSFPT